MSATRPEFKAFPRNRRLSVREQSEHDEYSRQMYVFMQNKVEDHKLNALREEIRKEEKKYFRAVRKQKRAMKKAKESGCSSVSSTQLQGVPLVPNPFYVGPAAQPTVQLVVNPFYDPSYVAKASK